MNVIALLDDACVRAPAATALVWGPPGHQQSLTFEKLHERSHRIAALFRDSGLVPGDAVAIAVPPCGALYEVMAAVLRAGLVAVFVEPRHWRQTLEQAARHLRLRAFVGTPRACAFRCVVPTLRRIPLAFVTSGVFPGARSLGTSTRGAFRSVTEPCEADALALLTFTSGSTGPPKGVLRSHGMLRATHEILSRSLGLHPGELGLTNLPFIVFVNLAAGVGSVLPDIDLRRPERLDAKRLVRSLRDPDVANLVTTPFAARRIVERCEQQKATLDALRRIHVGGAPVLPQLLDRLAAAAPQAQVGAIYGATEVEPIATFDRSEYGVEERMRVVEGGGLLLGRPVGGIAVRVVADSRGAARAHDKVPSDVDALPQGPCGEIIVCGPNVSPGYLGGAGDRESKIAANGSLWHRTGDAGYFDSRGRLWLTGRCTTGVARGPKRFYSLQAEAALAGLPQVACTALVETEGGRLVLVVEPTGKAEEIRTNELLGRVAWCPLDEIALVKQIPLDARHHAKVRYPDVRKLLERGEWLVRTNVASGNP